MDPEFLQKLRARSATIHVRWDTLLRLEPVSGPLANPDALVRLIPETLARVLTLLAGDGGEPVSLEAATHDHLPACDCGHNPYLAYFVAGEQAFTETAVLLQAELPPGGRHQADIAAIIRAIRSLARDEIDTFCTICAHRGEAHACRHGHGKAADATA